MNILDMLPLINILILTCWAQRYEGTSAWHDDTTMTLEGSGQKTYHYIGGSYRRTQESCRRDQEIKYIVFQAFCYDVREKSVFLWYSMYCVAREEGEALIWCCSSDAGSKSWSKRDQVAQEVDGEPGCLNWRPDKGSLTSYLS